MNIIIGAELVNPPSVVSTVRDLTLFCKVWKNRTVLVEVADWSMVDSYYNWLKRYGAFDFVDDFVKLNQEKGFRIDLAPRQPPSVTVDRIVPENLHCILKNLEIL